MVEQLEIEPSLDEDLRAAKLATKLAFFIAGFGLASWAPLVPYAQARLHVNSAELGTILLCLGLGALAGMLAGGYLAARIGCRWVIVWAAIAMAAMLPLLASVGTPAAICLCLGVFGAGLGAIDVSANIHGAEVQDKAGLPLMSGFHGLYSIGGLAGVSAMTAVLALGAQAFVGAIGSTVIILGCIVVAAPGFIRNRATGEAHGMALPKGPVLVIGGLALATFLTEGAVLDWSALLMTKMKHIDVALSGSAYTAFASAMAVSRMIGDRTVAKFGEKRTLYSGLLATGCGLLLAVYVEQFAGALVGMALAGFSVGNVVPVLFTLAGRQTAMPASKAIVLVSILGYVGVLMGPAFVGYVAQLIGLDSAFMSLAALMVIATVAVSSLFSSKRFAS